MFLSTNLYRAVTEPPAHLLHINDSAVAVREHRVGEDDLILITRVQHHETRHSWHQAFILTRAQAQRLAADLLVHVYGESLSHDLLRRIHNADGNPIANEPEGDPDCPDL